MTAEDYVAVVAGELRGRDPQLSTRQRVRGPGVLSDYFQIQPSTTSHRSSFGPTLTTSRSVSRWIKLVGKTAIAGAASGIGFAMASRFAEAGMDIVLADIENKAR
ncbi:MAG: hypothetical protein R2706_11945 [Acidimicrobiales bacterium]